MNRLYLKPEITTELFDIENIVTQSGTNERVVRSELISGGVNSENVKTYTFDELISAE